MHYKVRKLTAARQRIKEQLTALGWTEEKELYNKLDGSVDIHAMYLSPNIDAAHFRYENNLKKINHGEAFFALETYAQELAHISWRCNFSNPNNHDPLDTLDAFEYAREMMLDGVDFNYYEGREEVAKELNLPPSRYKGHINIIDWEHPENNTFEFVEGWRGALNDGFGWDIILLVNSIPLGAILLEADDRKEIEEKSTKPCQKALDLAQFELDADFQFPVYCHFLIISNGKQLLAGDPWMELDEFTPIDSVAEVLKPADFLKTRIQNPV